MFSTKFVMTRVEVNAYPLLVIDDKIYPVSKGFKIIWYYNKKVKLEWPSYLFWHNYQSIG